MPSSDKSDKNVPKRILYLGLDPANYPAQAKVDHWPIIQIVPRPLTEYSIQKALKRFDEYTHVIITSKSAVGILKDYLPLIGITFESWAAKTTLAQGKVTAKHLQACGIKPARIASEETAEGLIHEIKQLDLTNAHFFWPHSSESRPVLADFFDAQSIRCTPCILYDPKPRIPGKLPDLGNYDEIVFTSPSTVNAFLEVFGKFPPHLTLTPIGPVTARHLNCARIALN